MSWSLWAGWQSCQACSRCQLGVCMSVARQRPERSIKQDCTLSQQKNLTQSSNDSGAFGEGGQQRDCGASCSRDHATSVEKLWM